MTFTITLKADIMDRACQDKQYAREVLVAALEQLGLDLEDYRLASKQLRRDSCKDPWQVVCTIDE